MSANANPLFVRERHQIYDGEVYHRTHGRHHDIVGLYLQFGYTFKKSLNLDLDLRLSLLLSRSSSSMILVKRGFFLAEELCFDGRSSSSRLIDTIRLSELPFLVRLIVMSCVHNSALFTVITTRCGEESESEYGTGPICTAVLVNALCPVIRNSLKLFEFIFARNKR